MAGTIHKISAGCGYEYLTRQVAAMDATDRGRVKLADYYSAKGESPGRWIGSGLPGLGDPVAPPATGLACLTVTAGDIVTAEQMRALFGEGRHPNADQIEEAIAGQGGDSAEQLAGSALGQRWEESTAQPEFRVRMAEAFVAHNLARGQSWDSPIDDETKATMRSGLARVMFREVYRRDPGDDRELSGYMARVNRPTPQGVAGYDLTFSPVKSVSTLWALGHNLDETVVIDGQRMNISTVIEHAHDRAVADAIGFVEQHAAFGRLGTGGIEQVDCEGLIATAFTHRDARSGDPDLHTHVAVSNKVRVRRASGETTWVALDGTPLYKAIVTASEVYNSRIEAHLRSLLGVQFAAKQQADKSKRPIREIVGIPQKLMDRWSTRRAAIEVETGKLAAQFQREHGREPTSTEMFDLAQKATLATRDAKHEPRSLGEQRDAWWEQAQQVLGTPEHVRSMLASALHSSAEPVREGGLRPAEAHALGERVIAVVSESRARWQRPHLRAEAERQLREGGLSGVYGAGGSGTLDVADTRLDWPGWVSSDQWSRAVEAIVDAAEQSSVAQGREAHDGDQGEPQLLRRRTGESVYTTHDTALFTSAAILSAERRIVAAAGRCDARIVDSINIDLALLEQTANGRGLNAGQSALVRELASSGRRVQVALAPAGTGKTTAMRAFGRAWSDSGGTVIGLAPTAAAAAVLREDLGTTTDTLAKLVQLVEDQQFYDTLIEAATVPRWRAATDSTVRTRRDRARELLDSGDVRAPKLPDWFEAIDADCVIVVDEAGMASTADLDVLVSFAQSRGAAVRLVGDDQQLASISAGGVLRDVAHETGALTLSEVVRFSDTAEGAASLALRNGDPSALGYLADEHRIHVAADMVAADQAFRAWLTHQDNGHDAVMLAATRETTNHLNEQARAERLARAANRAVGAEIELSDGLCASVGDIVCTRRNSRSLRTSATDWVRNGDRWEVTEINDAGDMTVRHLDRGRSVTLPAGYVSDYVTLGYASTIHAAQGMTADYCHVVGSDSLSRQLFYVAMTRGRHGNHVYLSTAEADPHKVLTPKAITPQSAIEVLSKVLERDESQRSATTSDREAHDPTRRLGAAVRAFDDAVGTLAEAQIGEERLHEITTAAESLHPGLIGTDAWQVLRKHLAVVDLGGDAVSELAAVYQSREVDTALDVGAVLDWRLDSSGGHSRDRGPLPWVGGVPQTLADTTHTDYLRRRADLVRTLTDNVTTIAHSWSVHDCPTWARPFVAAGADPDLVADLAVFRAALEVPDADQRPTGPPCPQIATSRYQRALQMRADAVVSSSTDHQRWSPLATSIDPHLTSDPYWPRLADDLSALSRSGLDVEALVRTEAARGDLPTEMPAAALWWRLSRKVDQPAVDTTESGLRPDWINDVADVLGSRYAEVVIADPHWPALVAAITTAEHTTWTPRELLATTMGMLSAAADEAGERLRPHELARGLAWRVDILLQEHPTSAEAPLPLDAPLSPDEEEELAHNFPDDLAVDGDDRVVDEIDDGYLDALLQGDVPCDAADLESVRIAEDAWNDLDFGDHAEVRPPSRAEPRRDLGGLVADYYELTTRHSEITAAIETLATAIDSRRGPHATAVADYLVGLRQTADHQHPAVVALEWAQDDLLDAKVAEATLIAEMTAVAARAEALSEQLDSGLIGADPARHLDPDYQSPEDLLLELRGEQRLLVARVDAASAVASDCGQRLDVARAELTAAIAETGGALVTSEDVESQWRTAQSLDMADLADLRAERRSVAAQLMRTENALAHRHAVQRTATHRAATPAYALAQEQTDQALRGVSEYLAEDPVRQIADADLTSTIASIRRRISRTERDLMVSGRIPADNVERVRRAHARLSDQVSAIRAARSAATDAAAAADLVAQVESRIRQHQMTTPTRRERGVHEQTSGELSQTLSRVREAHRRLEDLAGHAAREVGAAQTQWPSLLASADPARVAAEIRQAQTADDANRAAAESDRETLRSAEHKLERALQEVGRRDRLDAADRDVEDQVRLAARPASATQMGTGSGHASYAPVVSDTGIHSAVDAGIEDGPAR